jgi:DNA-binding transcriptional MerR regulator/quercetin dioxygenase-like cupin family protein
VGVRCFREKVMAYTVKQVAAMSGVSVRTLHFYDETGLLKPAHTGANGYRFYEEPQLLALQQILFYRELEFELKQIKEILRRTDFEKIAALQSHRAALQAKLVQTQSLIETIDKTVEHLKGTRNMKTEEMFVGFSVGAGHDRFGERVQLGGPGGEPIDCKVSGQDTGGAMCVFEFNSYGCGPKHLHWEQDEWIYVVDGEYEFHIGDRQFLARAGESVFIPRGVAHVWGRAGEKVGRVINVYQPAGKMEEFFREVGKYDGKPAVHEALGVDGLRQLLDSYGMKLLGPPLGWERDPSAREAPSG